MTVLDTTKSDLDSLEVDFDENPTEVYISVSDRDWATALSQAEKNPDQVKTWVSRHDDGRLLWRFLPLHSTCARRPPDSVVDCLLRLYPEGSNCLDDQGMLPLHYACGNHASDTVINTLILVNPKATETKEPNGGKLPIHHVCQWGASSIGVVNMLLTAYPECVHVKDIDGNTPLDLAKSASYENRTSIIQSLERCANATKWKRRDRDGASANFSQGVTALQTSVGRIMALKEEHASLKCEVGMMGNHLQCAHDALEKSEERKTRLQNERDLLLGDLAAHENDLEELKDAREDLGKIHFLEQENESYLNDLKQSEKEVSRVWATHVTAKADNELIQAELASVKIQTTKSEEETYSARVCLGLIKEEFDDMMRKSTEPHVVQSNEDENEVRELRTKFLDDHHLVNVILHLRKIIAFGRFAKNEIESLRHKMDDTLVTKNGTDYDKMDLERKLQSVREDKVSTENKLNRIQSAVMSYLEDQVTPLMHQSDEMERFSIARKQKLTEIAALEETIQDIHLGETKKASEKCKLEISNLLNALRLEITV